MANTTNLNLVKPAGTDHALVSDINGNMDLIDAFAGSTNEAIANLNNPTTTADILASAVSVNKVTVFKGNGSSYTGVVPSALYRYGIFVVTPRDNNRIVQAVADGAYAVNYYNGSTWNGWQEFATMDSTVVTVGPTNGLTLKYLIRSGYCYCTISGNPTTTDNIEFTVPKALMGAYITEGQWQTSSIMIQVWIDADTTKMSIRNHNTQNCNVSIMYPVK